MKPSWQRIGGIALLALLLLILEFGSLLLVGKLFPLPKGQGLQYVAHPFWALVGSCLTVIAFVVMMARQPDRRWRWFIGAFLLSLLIHLLIFVNP
ncbi:MAG: hypothetical protein AAFQ87_05095 [Bacteroidota bacterium]